MRGLMVLRTLVVDPQPVLDVGPVVLDDDVGRLDHAAEDLDPLRRLEIERQRAFVAVQVQHVVAVARTADPLVRVDARGRLDLDDVGSEVGEHAAAGRAGTDARQVEHPQVREGGGGDDRCHGRSSDMVPVSRAAG